MENAEPEAITIHNIILLIQKLFDDIDTNEEGSLFSCKRKVMVKDVMFDTEESKMSSAYQQLQVIFENAKDTRMSVLSVLRTALEPYMSYKDIIDFTSESTFDIRGLRFLFVVQSLAALRQNYSKDEANNIITNCASWLLMRSSEYEIHRLVQERLGYAVLPSGREIHLVSISEMNEIRFGEVLFVHKGKGIFVRLPDISEYKLPYVPLRCYVPKSDNKNIGERIWDIKDWCYKKMAKQRKIGVGNLKNKNPETINKKSDKNKIGDKSIDIDALIAEIDKKLEELEAEEKAQKEAKEKSKKKQGDNRNKENDS